MTRTTPEESESYFRTRDRGSQIGAWASKQSETISEVSLEEERHEIESRFKDQDVPLPKFWGGYRVSPHRIEFWQGRDNRLHDRIIYKKINKKKWKKYRLNP